MPSKDEGAGELWSAQSGNSPSATLTEIVGGTTRRTSLQTRASARPRGPRSGSFTSMTAAPPAKAARASSAERTLTRRPAMATPDRSSKQSMGSAKFRSNGRGHGRLRADPDALDDRIETEESSRAEQVGDQVAP